MRDLSFLLCRSGDWIYQAADILTVLLAAGLIFYARTRCWASVNQQRDKDTCIVVIPVVVAFVLALVIHPTLNQNLVADVSWTFALYVETISMAPQLFMMVSTLTCNKEQGLRAQINSEVLF